MVTYSDDASILLSSTLTPTKGLHTTSTTRLALHRGDRRRSPCTLHLYFTLPTQLFADPYELAPRGESYRFERFGGGNLEAPVFAPGAGADAPSGLLLDLIVPEGGEAVEDVGIGGDGDGEDGSVVQIDVPLHARYGVPKMGGGERIDEVTLPIPEAFWACPTTNSRNIEGAPPVIHTHFFFFFFCSAVWPNESNSHQLLSYVCTAEQHMQMPDALRQVVELAPALVGGGERTLVSIPRAESVRAQTLRVPVGDAEDVAVVEAGTIVVVLLAFVYLFRTIRARARFGAGAVYVSVAKKEG